MKQMPQVQKFMTPMPHTIGQEVVIGKALDMMREYRIRHLPVTSGGTLVGMLTDRDVKLATSFKDSISLTVEGVMTPEPFTVLPEAPLNRVVSEMAEHKYGSAVVQQANGKIVGIFTAIDGLRVLAEQLEEFHKPSLTDSSVRTHV